MMYLNSTYNRDDFLNFLVENFLHDFKKDIRPANTQGLSSIQRAYSLGRSENLDLQVFEFSFAGSPNKRVTLTKDAFQIMRSHAIFQALAVFHSPDSNDWRFSFLTATPERTEKGKVTLSYSNPKRLSFFLGPNAKVKTPTKFLLKKGEVIDFEDLKSRFSIEVVNKEFYQEISELFTQLVGGSVFKGKKREDYQALLKLPGIQDHSQTSLEFAVRLIGRVIFCWFLREKKSDRDKSLMPNDLLSLEAVKQNPDYYHKILEPIFFEVLNKPARSRKDSYINKPFSSIPYLNGGLFSPHNDDFFSYNEGRQAAYYNMVIIPDEWIRKFFEVLETYNFTIDENTSFDEELSIDPEMLGRIFENLLAEINPETGESARKSTGSYYTPRVIVDYMIDESLLLYLRQQTQIDDEKLRAVISYDLNDVGDDPLTEEERERIITALEKVKILDPACGSGAFPIGALQKIVFILQQTDPVGQLWFKKQIKNTSPEIRRVIQKEFEHKNFDYIRKLGIIRENIYGIDIQPIATEISRLRCFLTLVVDERIQEDSENRGIEPLPNLDFKFVTANTLIGLLGSQAYSQRGLFEDVAGINELKELRDMFFNASGTERDQLKLQFIQAQNRMFQRLVSDGTRGHADLTTKLTTWDPFSHKPSSWFDAEWMFDIKDGFDIIIANPPYLGESGHKEAFREISHNGQNKFYQRKMDLFYFFFHFALDVGKLNSQIAFISTNYYLTANGAKKLRQDLRERSIVNQLINFNELKIFESALGQHNMLTLLTKSGNTRNRGNLVKTSMTRRAGIATPEILLNIMSGNDPETDYFSFPVNELYDGDDYYIRIDGVGQNRVNTGQQIINKIKSQGEVLSNFANVSQGLLTGIDKITDKHIVAGLVDPKYKGYGVYIISKGDFETLRLNESEKKLLRASFKNSDIKRYYCNQTPNSYVIYLTRNLNLKDYPNLEAHLYKFEKAIKARSKDRGEMQAALKMGKWWVIFAARDVKVFEGPKIICPQRAYENSFAYNEVDWFACTDVYYITKKNGNIKLKYILSLLNSKLYYLWFYLRGKRKGEMLELFYTPLMEVPIKKISEEKQVPFIEAVDKILSLTGSDDYLQSAAKQVQVKEYEKQIDQMVYKLYDLTEEEIKIVEGIHQKGR